MHGKHSLTASVVAIGGPDGPRYYPESLSMAGADALASTFRSSGVPAVAIPVHLRMPEPRRFLNEQGVAAPPRLFAAVHDDPFDLIEAEVLAATGNREESSEPVAASGQKPFNNAELEDSDDLDAMADGETEHTGEVLGDESTYYGTAEFERLEDRWTVWLVEVDCRERPGLIAACRTLKKAMQEADVPRGPGADWATIIIGPGYGGVRVDNIMLWPHAWTVRTVIDEEIYPEESVFPGSGDPVDREQAKDLATAIADSDSCGIKGCPIITAPYRPVAKGGER